MFSRARAKLNERHAGLGRVKERLLDHVAAHGVASGLPGPVLCRQGRPASARCFWRGVSPRPSGCGAGCRKWDALRSPSSSRTRSWCGRCRTPSARRARVTWRPARRGASGVRPALEGSRPLRFASGRSITPSVELGVRQDGGDAETGLGLETGLRRRLRRPNRDARTRSMAAATLRCGNARMCCTKSTCGPSAGPMRSHGLSSGFPSHTTAHSMIEPMHCRMRRAVDGRACQTGRSV